MIKILVVDDEENIRKSLKDILEDEGYQAIVAENGVKALNAIKRENPHIVLLDIWMPNIGGIEVLQRVKEDYPWIVVIMISGHGTIETAVKAIKLGAYDFIEKPLSLERLLHVVQNAAEHQRLTNENQLLKKKIQQEMYIGESPAMKDIDTKIKQIAKSDVRVLITGENGTGKELIASRLHYLSVRSHNAFIQVNCAAIPETLIESELFGHEKGAFTNAIATRIGKFELANNGTLFLDEISDMSLNAQAKVLRVLQEQKFERLGSVKTITVDVRVIAATNKNLEKEIEKGQFREDLLYRLNVIPIHIPPLRERREDIPGMAEYFLALFADNTGKKPKKITEGALAVLTDYSWPGNVRELRNFIERINIMVAHDEITAANVNQYLHKLTAKESAPALNQFADFNSLKKMREHYEAEFIRYMLAQNDGQISKTAQELGIERSNLYRKMKQYSITVADAEIRHG